MEKPVDIELNPYGVDGRSLYDKGLIKPDNAVLLARARAKLVRIRSGERKEQKYWTSGKTTALILPFAMTGIGVGYLYTVEGIVTGILNAVALLYLLAYILAILVWMPKPWKPVSMLRGFYRALNRSKHDQAAQFVTVHDLDSLPRFTPDVSEIVKSDGVPRLFESLAEFCDYWKYTLHFRWGHVVGVFTIREKVTKLADDVVKIDVSYFTQPLNLLHILFPWVLLFRIAKARTFGRTGSPTVTKLMVKTGKEWKLFNGEWQGYDETNLSWIPSNN